MAAGHVRRWARTYAGGARGRAKRWKPLGASVRPTTMFFTRRGSRFGCAMAEIVFHGQGRFGRGSGRALPKTPRRALPADMTR
jgi:hypothetical protein